MTDFYDWQTDQVVSTPDLGPRVNPRDWDKPAHGPVNAELVDYYRQQQDQSVNPVTRHGRGCECRNCGWYVDRLAAETRYVEPRPVVPAERRPRPLTDQVVPVACLMAMLTLCGIFVIPVVTPLIGLMAVSTVAIATAAVALAAVTVVFLVVAMKLRKSFDREPKAIRGRITNR